VSNGDSRPAGQLGRPDEARASIEMLRQDFDYDLARIRAEYARWGHAEAFIDHMVEGLVKALPLA